MRKSNGQSFAELTYDAWGMPESPNKLLNNDHGNYVFATFTGHIYDTTLDIYFAEARFYDADNRIWLAADPVKGGGNWYQYCYSNPVTYWDPTGLWGIVTGTKQALLAGSEIEPALFWRQRDFFEGPWWQNEENLIIAYEMLLKESESRDMTIITLAEDYDYFDYFGYCNTRIYTLQALIGDKRTGVYSASTMVALENVFISKNVKYDNDMPLELTSANLKVIRDWYNGYTEFSKKSAYLLENGLGDIIEGSLTAAAYHYAISSVETISVIEDITRQDKTVWTGKVEAVERVIYDANGNRYTDLDIELDGVIIQVKSGSGKGLTTQMEKSALATGKTDISYTPDIKQSAAVLKGVRSKGFETFTDSDELLEFLKEFWN